MIAAKLGLDSDTPDVHAASARGRALSLLEATAHTGGVPDEEDRPLDASSAAGAGSPGPGHPDLSWAEATAPDDISELEADIAAYHRERRAARRRARLSRCAPRSSLASLSLTVAALAIIAVAATLLTVMAPRGIRPAPSQLPLAQSARPAGLTDGVLPSVALPTGAGTTVVSTSLRPAVIALLPHPCACDALVRRIAAAASAADRIGMYAVTTSRADADALSGRLLEPVDVLRDSDGTLGAAARADGVTVLLVDRAGRIDEVIRRATTARLAGLSNRLMTVLGTTEATA